MSATKLRYVGVALVICGVVVSVTGIGAFSITEADRTVSVGVGGESTSYLGISTTEKVVTANGTDDARRIGRERASENDQGTRIVLGTVTNFFPGPLESIEVTLADATAGSLTVHDPKVTGLPLDSGSPGNLVARVNCGGASRSTGTVTLKFTAKGPDTAATTERTVPITCVNESSQPASSNSP